MSDKELLPCPFCGVYADNSAGHKDDCYLRAIIEYHRDGGTEFTKEEFEDMYNTRATPLGFKMVPVEPTTEMRKAWRENQGEPAISAPDEQWAAMLDAAP